MVSAMQRREACLRLLVDAGCDVEAQNNEGSLPLAPKKKRPFDRPAGQFDSMPKCRTPVQRKPCVCSAALLRRAAPLLYNTRMPIPQSDPSLNSLLVSSSAKADLAAVQKLLACGADPKASNACGMTALMAALGRRDPAGLAIAKTLLPLSDLRARDISGSGLAAYAARSGSLESTVLLAGARLPEEALRSDHSGFDPSVHAGDQAMKAFVERLAVGVGCANPKPNQESAPKKRL